MKTNPRRTAGFSLVEFLVAIVFIGVVVGPLIVFVSRIHDLNSAVGQQARREAWRSFADQAVVHGVDPSLAPGLSSAANLAIPAVTMPRIEQGVMLPQPGLPSIVALHTTIASDVAEARLVASGWQIGAGAEVAPRTAPLAPLSPIVLGRPVVNPADGAMIVATTLTPAAGGPNTLAISATGAAGAAVTLALNQPNTRQSGISATQATVTAVDLANRVSGSAWCEYAGNDLAGDRAVALADGRTRWLVTRADGRLQIYEPSTTVPFAYQLSLGALVLVHGHDVHAAGTTLAFNYAAYADVQSAVTTLRIDFPADVKQTFGDAWDSLSVGYQWTFGGEAGPFSGDAGPFFSSDRLSVWQDSVTIAALPMLPAGAIAQAAEWTVRRETTRLGVPVLATAGDAAGFHPPGSMQFNAPNGPDGSPIGRLSFDHGANVSTGTTLAVTVVP